MNTLRSPRYLLLISVVTPRDGIEAFLLPTTATEIAPSPSRPKQHLLLSLSLSSSFFFLLYLFLAYLPRGGLKTEAEGEPTWAKKTSSLHLRELCTAGGRGEGGGGVEPRFWQKEKKGEGETSHTSSSLSGLPLIMRSLLLFFLRECEHCIVYERNEPSFQSLAIWHRWGKRKRRLLLVAEGI